MKIKIKTIDTSIISFLLISTVLPITFSKIMISTSFIAILLRIFLSKDFLKYYNNKILILILFLPVLFNSFLYDLKETIRYLVILMIVLGLPYSSFRINSSPINKVSLLCLFYLIISQILLIFQNEVIYNFRDYAYKTEWSYVFLSYGKVDNILDVFVDESFRAGGLYYNPNILANLIFLYFIIFDLTYKENNTNYISKKNYFLKKINLYNVIFIIIVLSILLTKSRTVIIALLIYFSLVNFEFKNILNLKINKKIFSLIFLVILIFLSLGDRLIEGFLNQDGSFYLKYNIFYNHLLNADFFEILFGGTFEKQFDTEYGKLFGASGLLGTLGYFYFLKLIADINVKAKQVVLSLLIISFGTTIFLSLLKISIILPIIIIICSLKKKPKIAILN